MNYLIYIIIYSLVNTAGLTLVKLGVVSQSIGGLSSIIQSLFTPKVFAGYLLIGASALIGIKALSLTKFSIFAPIALGLNLLLITLVAVLLLKENITSNMYLGSLLIVLGIYVLTR